MATTNALADLDDLSTKMEQITSMANAIGDAMIYSPNAEETFTPALQLLATLLTNSSKSLTADVATLFKENKAVRVCPSEGGVKI